MKTEYEANLELQRGVSPHRYVYTPERKRSALQWAMMACTVLALSAIGVVLARAVVLWLSNGQLV